MLPLAVGFILTTLLCPQCTGLAQTADTVHVKQSGPGPCVLTGDKQAVFPADMLNTREGISLQKPLQEIFHA